MADLVQGEEDEMQRACRRATSMAAALANLDAQVAVEAFRYGALYGDIAQ